MMWVGVTTKNKSIRRNSTQQESFDYYQVISTETSENISEDPGQPNKNTSEEISSHSRKRNDPDQGLWSKKKRLFFLQGKPNQVENRREGCLLKAKSQGLKPSVLVLDLAQDMIVRLDRRYHTNTMTLCVTHKI